MKNQKVFIVDDDAPTLKKQSAILLNLGWEVKTSRSSEKALDQIAAFHPDCVILDIMMPGIDGLELCRQIRAKPELNECFIIISSSKPYDTDRNRAFSFGADGYIVKPFTEEKFLEAFKEIVKISMTFWGVRGTLPVPGPKSIFYGGNTSCVSLKLSKDRWFIFDSGTGIKALSDHLLQTQQTKIKANIYITHPHWDHINAIPFFVPLYIPGNEITVSGPTQNGGLTIHKMMSDQMDGVYFPITIENFAAHVIYNDLNEGKYMIDGISVQTLLLNHPGNCLGYQIKHKNRTICYITDNELYFEDSPYFNFTFWKKLVSFVKNADVLIHDATYFNEDYSKKILWGHSPISEVVRLAHEASVKKLYLFHHDPSQTDEDIKRKGQLAQELLLKWGSKTDCILPKEQEEILL